jgi:hypothetical protein
LEDEFEVVLYLSRSHVVVRPVAPAMRLDRMTGGHRWFYDVTVSVRLLSPHEKHGLDI